MPERKVYRFGEFELNPAKREILRAREEVSLNDSQFDLLLFLIESAPKTCTYDEIIETARGGQSVEYNSIEKEISSIRKALGEDVKKPRFIRTIRSKGYLFIGDLDESTDRSSNKSHDEVEISEAKSRNSCNSQRPKLFFFAALLISLISIIPLIFWRGDNIFAWYNSKIIFADNFSSEQIDPDRWTVKGKRVKVENGKATLIVEETDNWGRLESSFFSFDMNKPITLKSRLKVMYSQNLKDKVYFHGHFGFVIKDSHFNAEEGFKTFFGVKYSNYDYESKYADGNTKEQKAEGFFLVKGAGDPSNRIDYETGKVGPRIRPIWDDWFEQKIVYEPFSGEMKYFINDLLMQEFNVGKFSSDIEENKLRLDINPQGWWLYHSIELDYVEVTQ